MDNFKETVSMIISEQNMWQQHIASSGKYEIVKNKDQFLFEGKLWTYWNSGLARTVYKSDCGKWVIKIPYVDFMDEKDAKRYLNEDYKYAPPAIHHNIGEASNPVVTSLLK